MSSKRAMWLLLLLGSIMLGGSMLQAQEDAPTVKRKAARGRMPAHYAQVVSPDQKEKIYAIQSSYAPRMKELRDQLAALQTERDAKCREVLSPEQQKRLDELAAAAKAAREAKAEAENAAPPAATKPVAKAGGN